MLKFTLRLKPGPEDTLILSPGPLMRILFGIMAAALLLAVLANPEESVPVLGVVLMVIAFLGMFYEEKWTFDKKSGTVTARTGLMFFAKTDRLAFDRIGRFLLYTSPGPAGPENPGKIPRFPGRASRYVLFALELDDGKQKNIELVKTRDASELKEKALTVAGYCEKPLSEE